MGIRTVVLASYVTEESSLVLSLLEQLQIHALVSFPSL